MSRIIATIIFVALTIALVIYWTRQHRQQTYAMEAIPAAIPRADPIVIPWVLTTQCTITSRNLPVRQPDRSA